MKIVKIFVAALDLAQCVSASAHVKDGLAQKFVLWVELVRLLIRLPGLVECSKC